LALAIVRRRIRRSVARVEGGRIRLASDFQDLASDWR
jgi:hypothetical protein